MNTKITSSSTGGSRQPWGRRPTSPGPNSSATQGRQILGKFTSAPLTPITVSHLALRIQCRDRLRELEDRRARSRPIVSLVDNMVKLGSLYRGPGNAPLSHRIRYDGNLGTLKHRSVVLMMLLSLRNLPTSNAKESPAMAATAAPPAATANVATTFSGSVAKTSEESARLERRADVQVFTKHHQPNTK